MTSAWAGLGAGFLHTLSGPDHLAVRQACLVVTADHVDLEKQHPLCTNGLPLVGARVLINTTIAGVIHQVNSSGL